jgi:hypothetical protein
MTAAITAVTGFEGGNFYEAPAGKLVGQVPGFTAAVLVEPFSTNTEQVIFANSDLVSRGWVIETQKFTLTARVFHDGPGFIKVTHDLDAAGFGRLVLPILIFTGSAVSLIVNGSFIGATMLPGGTSYLPATTQAALGAGSGGATPFLGGTIVGAAYSDVSYPTDAFRAHWLACLSTRDFVDGQLGSLYGPLLVPTFEHVYSARRGNSGGPGAVPSLPSPFVPSGPVWPDERGTGGAVNFAQVGQNFVVTIRDGI